MTTPLRTTTRSLLFTALLYGTTAWGEALQFNSGEHQTTLIELFTSQGCSSCPPAERWLGGLQQDPRLWKKLIPLAFHVDYWDSLGWKDQFANPAYSERQRRYKREGVLGVVYTPGFVVNGHEWRRWFGLSNIPESDQRVGELKLELDGNALRARYTPVIAEEKSLILNVAVLGVGLTVDVTRGENAGKQLSQDFSVLEHRQWRSTNGEWAVTLPEVDLAAGARPAIAAWVNRSDSQTPIQAVGGWLPAELFPAK